MFFLNQALCHGSIVLAYVTERRWYDFPAFVDALLWLQPLIRCEQYRKSGAIHLKWPLPFSTGRIGIGSSTLTAKRGGQDVNSAR